MRILISSGGTIVPLDEVRRIQNMSSGRFGAAIAKSALKNRHEVNFLYARNSYTPFTFKYDPGVEGISREDLNVQVILRRLLDVDDFYHEVRDRYYPLEYKTFDDYLDRVVYESARSYDVIILAAAVSDYGVRGKAKGKISSDQKQVQFTLEQLPKVIKRVKELNPDVFLVGFKLLVDTDHMSMVAAAEKQIASCGTDLVVANDLRKMKEGNHTLSLFSKTHGYLSDLEQKTCDANGLTLAHSLFSIIQREAMRKVG